MKKARGLLEALPEEGRDADWFFLMLRCLVLAEDYDEAKKVAAKTRKFLDEYARNLIEQAEAQGYYGTQSELNMLRRNLAIIETILKDHDSIKDFFNKSTVAELDKSNLKVERMIRTERPRHHGLLSSCGQAHRAHRRRGRPGDEACN